MVNFNKTFTVEQLIIELQKFPPHLPLSTEGCDCDGDICDVTLEENYVYLRRTKEEEERNGLH